MAQQIAAAPIYNLCAKCVEILEWRKRMGKYKKLTQPKKWYFFPCELIQINSHSAKCNLKKITGAYHTYCKDCSKGVCAKCLESKEITQTEPPKHNQQKIDEEIFISRLNERQRRSYLRKLERDDNEEEIAQMKKRIMDGWKNKGEMDDDDDWDDDSEGSDFEE